MKVLLSLCALLALSSLALGNTIPIEEGYEFCYGTAGFQSSFQAPVGQTVAIDVYLYEHFNGTSFLLDDQDGMSSAGVKLTRTSAGPTEPAYVADVSAIAPNPAFNGGAPSPIEAVNGDIEASLVEYVHFTAVNGVQPIIIDTNTLAVFLGTFTFTMGSVPGEVTELLITDNDPSIYSNVTFSPEQPFDSLICDFAFEIVAIPEPATLSLLLVGGLATLRRRHA